MIMKLLAALGIIFIFVCISLVLGAIMAGLNFEKKEKKQWVKQRS